MGQDAVQSHGMIRGRRDPRRCIELVFRMTHFRTSLDIDQIGSSATMGLLGSCVAHDMRHTLFPHLHDCTYIWRVNTISLMSGAPSFLDLHSLTRGEDARDAVNLDVNKTFDLDRLLAEFVLIDFYRDTYGVFRLADGRWITHGLEFMTHGLERSLDIAEAVSAFERRYPRLWLESFMRFAARANAGRATFLIQPVLNCDALLPQGTGAPEARANARRINHLLGHMQRIALAALHRCYLLPFPVEDLELSPDHPYGTGPVHYTRDLFEQSCALVRRCPQSALSLPPDSRFRRRLIAAEIRAWRNRLAAA